VKRFGANPLAAHASTDALRAAHHEAVATSSSLSSAIALMVSSAHRARPSNHEGVLANARGPPLPTVFPKLSLRPPQRAARLRSRPHARPAKSTPAHLHRGPRDDNGAEVHPTQGCGGQGGGRPCRENALHRRPFCERTKKEHAKRSCVTIYVDGGTRREFRVSRGVAGRPRVPVLCQEPERSAKGGRGRSGKRRRRWPVRSTR
jgi:hypothetical protein